jgi:hypothetical protein
MKRGVLCSAVSALVVGWLWSSASTADANDPAGMSRYQRALDARRLSAAAPLSPAILDETLLAAQDLAASGRRDELIARLLELVENPRFVDYQDSDQGHAAVYALGDTLASAGADLPARFYLKKLLPLSPNDTYARRAVRRLVEIALDGDNFDPVLEDLKAVPSPGGPEETQGEIAYLSGRAREKAGDRDGALAFYAKVTERSRFWAQATYLSGLLEVERGRARDAENLFCKVADPKRSDQSAPFFADEKFFAVRDLARLALGRIAHEQFRFDDSRYYYYLVPQDSDRLAEALYESATGRYEKKDYEGARALLDELSALGVRHRYEDEAWILGAYVDLARCRFDQADASLKAFVARYEPVRDLAKRIAGDERGLVALLDAPPSVASSSRTAPPDAAQTIAGLVRLDPGYGVLTRRLAELDRQTSGLRGAAGQLADAERALATNGGVRPHGAEDESRTDEELGRARAEADGVRTALAALEEGRAASSETSALRRQLDDIDTRLRVAGAATPALRDATPSAEQDLPALLRADRARSLELQAAAQAARGKLVEARAAMARDAVSRLALRLSRLLRRARLGRIESVLGRKRALELEVEALANGVLPQSALDALEAPRYLRDDEEYWPFEGDDWPDEYVGAEGLR